MGLLDAGAPLLTPLFGGPKTNAKVDDLLAKDKKVHLSKILSDAGFTGDDLKTGMAVTLAESRGNPKAKNNTAGCGTNKDGTTARAIGLMQICTVNAGVAGFSSDPQTFETQMMDAESNAKAGRAILSSQGWGAWETFSNGAYRKYLGQDPMIQLGKSTLTGNVAATVKDALSPLDFLGKIASALVDPSTYFRLGKGALGGIMLILGTAALVFMIANKASGGKVASTAKKAAVTAAVL